MSRGTLCPVCVRPVRDGRCGRHGQWQSHQLVTARDRSLAERGQWASRTVHTHACPRCLGAVAESRSGWLCIDRGHAADPHGPFRVDELLGRHAQREALTSRMRLAHRRIARRRAAVTLPQLPSLDLRHTARLTGGAAVIAATLAYLVR